MNLSYYGRPETQVESAQFLKPNQGDKNVRPDELAAYARTLGFEAITRAGGDLNLLKQLLSNGFPVIVEFWLNPEDNGGLGHYRLFTGYDEAGDYFVAEDSLNGSGIKVPMAEFDAFWQVFNRTYVIVYPPDQTSLVHAIIDQDMLDKTMFEQALTTAQQEAQNDPTNAYAWFNIDTNYARLEQPELAASAFDQARRLDLPYRMLWYQFDIFQVYLAVGRYQADTAIQRYGLPRESPEVWAKLSPITYLSNASTPISIHHGELDTEVPSFLSLHLWQTMQAVNTPGEYFSYPHQGHFFTGQDWRLAMERTSTFFDQYVKE